MANDTLSDLVKPRKRRQKSDPGPALTVIPGGPSAEETAEAELESLLAALPPDLEVEEDAPPSWSWPSEEGLPEVEIAVHPTKQRKILAILTSDSRWRGAIWHDGYHRVDMIGRERRIDADTENLRAWIGGIYGVDASSEEVHKCIGLVAYRQRRDPLLDYLKGLVWDGVPRLRRLLVDGFGVLPRPVLTDDGAPILRPDGNPLDLVEEIGRRWAVQAIWRAMVPGCKADTVLLLYTPSHGKHKSTGLRALAGSAWFSDNPIQIGQDDVRASMQLRSAWIHEMGEMATLSKSTVEAIKSFMSRQSEEYVPKYGRILVKEDRRCVFAATTNRKDVLRDDSPYERRYCPVEPTRPADLVWLRSNRDQLWAEAVEEYQRAVKACDVGPGEAPVCPDLPEVRYWFSTTDPVDAPLIAAMTDHQAEYKEDEDAWTVAIREWAAKPENRAEAAEITTKRALEKIICMELAKIEKNDLSRVARSLKALGYKRTKVWKDGASINAYVKGAQ